MKAKNDYALEQIHCGAWFASNAAQPTNHGVWFAGKPGFYREE
jgi:hypothetical protein